MSILLLDFVRLNSSNPLAFVCMASSLCVDVDVDSNFSFGTLYGMAKVDGFGGCLSVWAFVSAVP